MSDVFGFLLQVLTYWVFMVGIPIVSIAIVSGLLGAAVGLAKSGIESAESRCGACGLLAVSLVLAFAAVGVGGIVFSRYAKLFAELVRR